MFYDITKFLKEQLEADAFVNTVTEGDIFDVDLNKQTIFPLSHIMINNVTHEGSVLRFSVSIIAMDIVDKTNDKAPNEFRGNDNEQDVLNTQLMVLVRMIEILRRGDINRNKYMLDGTPTYEAFTERFENFLAGWTASVDILIKHDMTIC